MATRKGIGLDSPSDPDPEASRKRPTRLLVIGVDRYEHWQDLQYPISDCDHLFGLLKAHYGFRDEDLLIPPLYNEQATADIIYDELYRLQEKDETGRPRLGPDDNLIVVFSGHGYMDEEIDEGYWVPAEAPPLRRASDLRKLVSASEVVKILSKVKAHHIVLIVDACFSGKFAQMSLDLPTGEAPGDPEEQPSRWVLTAGRLEPVADKSPFAAVLMQVLEENTEADLSIAWVGAEVMRRVGKEWGQKPWCGTLVEPRFEGGEYFFHRQSESGSGRPAAVVPKAATALRDRMRKGSLGHLERMQKGRFRLLRIEQLLLAESRLPGWIDTEVKTGSAAAALPRAIRSCWGQEKRHVLILGEGGMGKTVSLVRLWEEGLAAGEKGPIPVFVALNEFNAAPPGERVDFILRALARNCGLAMALTAEWKNAIWELLRNPLPSGLPAVQLLLDGFNEVTVEKDELLLELDRLSEQARGLQIIVSSRFVEIRHFAWARRSEVLELLPLRPAVVGAYLEKMEVARPPGEALRQLLTNPMMLTLYVGAGTIPERFREDNRLHFLPNASVGELLWNFHESQLALQLDAFAYDRDEQIYQLLLLRCLLPYIAYRMEAGGHFILPARKALDRAFNFKTLLDEAFRELNVEALTEVFPVFAGRRRALGLGKLTDLDAREQRALKARRYLVEKLHLLVLEDDVLRFVHQNFRDFFAACHLRNVAAMARIDGVLPREWQERALPGYLRRLLGEIEGEHHLRPQYDSRHGRLTLSGEDNLPAQLLDACRGHFEPEATGFLLWNVLRIVEATRGTLAGLDLSYLDLRSIPLNGMALSAHHGGSYLPAVLTGSLIEGRQFFFSGHHSGIRAVCYGPRGKVILSASKDGTIREWSRATGACLRTIDAHDNWVQSIEYSPDGQKILSASRDLTVKEWSAVTGECLHTYHGHQRRVVVARYSPDGSRILSASFDHTLREWSVATHDCLRIYEGHDQRLNDACYRPDGRRILSTSGDRTVREWSTDTGECLRTLEGHTGRVTCAVYSPDQEKILSASEDKTIREWSADTGECLRTLEGHTDQVLHLVYSPNGKKLLSTSEDNTLREWSVATGRCLRVYEGHFHRVHMAIYSGDGRRILSASDDKTIIEWSGVSGVILRKIEGQSDWLNNALFSEDGRRLLSVSYDKTVSEWWLDPVVCLQTFRGHAYWVRTSCYHPDGRKILTASDDGTLREWSRDTGACLLIYEGHTYGVRGAVYSADGRRIYSLSGQDTFIEHEAGRPRPVEVLRGAAALARARETVLAERPGPAEGPGVRWKQARLRIRLPERDKTLQIKNETGLLVQACDFRRLHPKARFSEDERARLRRYGALFDEEDVARWAGVVQQAFEEEKDR